MFAPSLWSMMPPMTEHLFRGHQHFLSRYLHAGDERAFLHRLASEGQRPGALYVGCSDSRVIPELLTSARPGDLFVVRNVANLVPVFEHADASVGAALEYAVSYLNVPHIVVCGHYGCGGVRAALQGVDAGGGSGCGPEDDCAALAAALKGAPSLIEWLEQVLPVARRVVVEEGLTGEAALRRAVEENVIEQLENLSTYPALKGRLESGALSMHGWVYDLYDPRLLVYDVEADRFVPAEEMARVT